LPLGEVGVGMGGRGRLWSPAGYLQHTSPSQTDVRPVTNTRNTTNTL
jgi:hypothetical protein